MQPGFEIKNVRLVIELAKKYGGKQEGEILEHDGKLHAAVRDPDGNTIELYEI
ncbi:MAG: catechol 2,3-dioxygenase-like lactoylglutathione lyase family enzyme [Limisphaerales bacterium]